jgi:hypothetical protein
MNTAELYTLMSEIVDLAALSNLGMDENPLDKLTAIFYRATKVKAMIDAEYEAMFADLIAAHEARQDARADAISAGWGHD